MTKGKVPSLIALLYLLIYSSMSTLDDPLEDLSMEYCTMWIDRHETREDELRFSGMETTDIVGYRFWEHRDNLPWRVDRRRSRVGLSVELSVLTYVLSHIGDMNSEEIVTMSILLYRDRIIEILRIRSIDREDEPISEVSAYG